MVNKVRMVPEEQWELPVSVTSDGRWISLREFTNPKIATLSSENLAEQLVPDGQEAELVEERIAHCPDFKVAMIDLGIVDQERAIQEVREQTPAGLTLIDIELRTIARIIKRVREGSR